MVVRKQKKSKRMRGRAWHGWGSKKKHRGAGNRSGRGNAGRGKRSGHKKPSFLKRMEFLGHKGFTVHGALQEKREARAVNVEFIQQHLDEFVREGKVEKRNDEYIIDAEKMGWQKILGSGQVREKLHITARVFSKKAKEKIEKAKGVVISAEQ
ncbi:uL15 family ribosomal protein [Candidatus Woesearchaeota archaeon]|nr:uL15 family ribosomal protein [Candidatus Woesearchaeota archaeon]